MNQGYLKLPRRLFKQALWQERRVYSKIEALIDLMAIARIAPGTVYDNGKSITLQKGMLVASNRYLQKRWQWSNTKVANFIDFLIQEHMIQKENSPLGSIITMLEDSSLKKGWIKTIPDTLVYTYTNAEGITRSIETPSDFLALWNAVYEHYAGKPCHRNILSPHNKQRLQTLKKHYGIEDFLVALKGLFENSNFGWTKTDPSHFLEIEHFQNYHTAGSTGQQLFTNQNKNIQKI